MPDAALAAQNGAATRLGDEELVASIEAQASALRARAEILRAELDEIEPHLARYEKSIKVLRGEPLTGTKGQGKPRSRPPGDDADRVRPKASRLSPERLESIRDAILAYAEDHEEFRQVDIRGTLEGKEANSSVMALAFETLRQENTIRFARQEGNAKWFRLTNAATQGATREALVGAERMVEVEQVVRELGAEGESFGYDVVTERTGLSHSGASYAMGELVRRGVLDEGRAPGRGGAKSFSLVEAVEA
jgi:hypothetical protein